MQTAATRLFKRYITFASVLIISGLVSRNAEAISLQLHYEWGDDTGISHVRDNGIPYSQRGLNIFLYEGDMLEFFLGGESAESNHSESRALSLFGANYFNYSYKYNAGVLGMRIKPFRNSRGNPYLVLGVVSGTAHYNVDFVGGSEVTSLSRDKASFTTYRTGLGLNKNIVDNLDIEAEANYTGKVPDVTATVSNASSVVNASDVSIYEKQIHYKPVIGISLGLRYHFW